MVLTRLTNTRLTLKCSLNFFTESYKKTQSKQQTYCRAIRKRCWWCFVIIIKERKQITSLKMQLLSICEHIVQVSKQVSALIYLLFGRSLESFFLTAAGFISIKCLLSRFLRQSTSLLYNLSVCRYYRIFYSIHAISKITTQVNKNCVQLKGRYGNIMKKK